MLYGNEVESHTRVAQRLIQFLKCISINPGEIITFVRQNENITYQIFKNYLNDIFVYFDINDEEDYVFLATPSHKANIVTI